jgi:hypothetical protein
LGIIFRRMGLPEQSLAFLTRGEKMSRPPLRAALANLPGLWRLVRTEQRLPKSFDHDDAPSLRRPSVSWTPVITHN